MSLRAALRLLLACLAVSEVRGWLGPAYSLSRSRWMTSGSSEVVEVRRSRVFYAGEATLRPRSSSVLHATTVDPNVGEKEGSKMRMSRKTRDGGEHEYSRGHNYHNKKHSSESPDFRHVPGGYR